MVPRGSMLQRKPLPQLGGKLLGFYLTMGQYDLVTIAEFLDDETVARAGLAGGSQGYLRSETLRAFTEVEYRKIITSLP
jgi:uncharacterized protein with GYD domain